LLYDGDCPLCRRAASFLHKRNRHGEFGFENIAAPGFDAVVFQTP
jgi:predicted DCC family thiol-disulfide oxidoreductase YuxK